MSKIFETTEDFKRDYRSMLMAEVGKDYSDAKSAIVPWPS